MAKKEKQSLQDVLLGIQKDFGEGILTSAIEEMGQLEVIPFSIPSMNRITGIGGIGKGRITEFHGMDGTFKTTFCLDLISQCQKMGGTAAFIDAEYSFSAEYAEVLGVDNEKLILIHPSSAEEAFTIIEKLVDSGQVDLIVLDSIASLSPSTELANDFGASNMGVMARLMGQFFRKITAKAGKTNTALVFINQLREMLGGYVPMKTTPAGNAIKFYASMRFEITKSAIKNGTDTIGVNLKVKCVKNKLAKPFLITEVEAMYGQGINIQKDVVNEAIESGVIQKGGAWLTYENEKYQGYDTFVKLLKDNPEFEQALITKIKNQLK